MILNSIKKVDGVWHLVIVQRNNGKIALIVTDYRKPDQTVVIKESTENKGKFLISIDSVQNKKLRLYISNHRSHLFYLMETYRLSKILKDADRPDNYTQFIEKRIAFCETKLEKNITKSKKKYIQ
jgi:hypothetical protein